MLVQPDDTSDLITFEIVVQPVPAEANHAPVADDDTMTVDEDAGPTIVPVLDGDVDADGDGLEIASATDPLHGTVEVSGDGSELTYRPDANYHGSDTFDYVISDGHGGSDVGAVSVTVTSVNDPRCDRRHVDSADQLGRHPGAGPVERHGPRRRRPHHHRRDRWRARHRRRQRRRCQPHLRARPELPRPGRVHLHDQRWGRIRHRDRPRHGRSRRRASRGLRATCALARADRRRSDDDGASQLGRDGPWHRHQELQASGQRRRRSWTAVALATAKTTTTTRSLSRGHAYRFRVRATDGAGNTSSYAAGPSLTPVRYSEASARITYRGAWKKTTSSKALGGAARHATASTKRATFRFTGYDVGWIATRTTSSGKARIFIDGILTGTVDLHRLEDGVPAVGLRPPFRDAGRPRAGDPARG